MSRPLARRAGASRRGRDRESAAQVECPAKTRKLAVAKGCEASSSVAASPLKTSMPPARPALRPAARSSRSPMIQDALKSSGRSRVAAKIMPAFGLRAGGRGAGRGRASGWYGQARTAVDKGASGRQVPNHALLHCREVRPAEQTTPDAGLVGDNDDGYACTIGGADYLRRPCDQPDFFRTPKMPASSTITPSRSRNSAGPDDRPLCLRSTSVQTPSPLIPYLSSQNDIVRKVSFSGAT